VSAAQPDHDQALGGAAVTQLLLEEALRPRQRLRRRKINDRRELFEDVEADVEPEDAKRRRHARKHRGTSARFFQRLGDGCELGPKLVERPFDAVNRGRNAGK